MRNYNEAARALGLALTMIPVTSSEDFDSAFARITRDRPDALVVSSIPLFAQHARQIASLAIERRLPSFTFSAAMARDGLLLGHSPEFLDMFRPAAAIVDKILRGTRPADIPVEQPTKFHFLINLKTARAIGIDIPPTPLAAADEVIE